MRIYVAGKVSKESVFGTHHWRDEFVRTLAALSGLSLTNLDPTRLESNQNDPEMVYGADAYLISQADCLIVYLSDDISVGGSQEILIAKYFKKPVIGLAPRGGKFNGSRKELFGTVIENYQDPFVFASCDIICDDIEAAAEALKTGVTTKPKDIEMIGRLAKDYAEKHLKNSTYLREIGL